MRGLLDPARPRGGGRRLRPGPRRGGHARWCSRTTCGCPRGPPTRSRSARLVAPALGATRDAPRPLRRLRRGARRATARRRSRRRASDPAIAILSDGPGSGAWFEHSAARRGARRPGRPARRSWRRRADGSSPAAAASADQLDVVYRRARRGPPQRRRGRADARSASSSCRRSSRAGSRCVNAFGTGLADDKLAHAYVEEMIRFYLGEEPLVALGADARPQRRRASASEALEPARRAGDQAARRLRRPRRDDHAAGRPRSSAARRSATCARRAGPLRRPGAGRALLATRRSAGAACGRGGSTCGPLCVSGRDGVTAMPGGLTRFARGAGELVVNSSRGGGCKDTWVVDADEAALAGLAPGPAADRRHDLRGAARRERRRRPRRASRRATRWRSASPTCAGSRRPAALPVVMPPLGEDAIESLLDRFDGICLSGGPDLDPQTYGADAAPGARPDRARPRPLRARRRRPRRRPRDPDPGDLPRHPGAQRVRGGTLHQHLPELSTEIAHRQKTPGDQPSHPVSIERGQQARRRSSAPPRSRSTPSTTRRSTGSARGWWSPRAPRRTVEAIEDPRRPLPGRRPVARRDPRPPALRGGALPPLRRSLPPRRRRVRRRSGREVA